MQSDCVEGSPSPGGTTPNTKSKPHARHLKMDEKCMTTGSTSAPDSNGSTPHRAWLDSGSLEGSLRRYRPARSSARRWARGRAPGGLVQSLAPRLRLVYESILLLTPRSAARALARHVVHLTPPPISFVQCRLISTHCWTSSSSRVQFFCGQFQREGREAGGW